MDPVGRKLTLRLISSRRIVIPAKAGIQFFRCVLGPRFRRSTIIWGFAASFSEEKPKIVCRAQLDSRGFIAIFNLQFSNAGHGCQRRLVNESSILAECKPIRRRETGEDRTQ